MSLFIKFEGRYKHPNSQRETSKKYRKLGNTNPRNLTLLIFYNPQKSGHPYFEFRTMFFSLCREIQTVLFPDKEKELTHITNVWRLSTLGRKKIQTLHKSPFQHLSRRGGPKYAKERRGGKDRVGQKPVFEGYRERMRGKSTEEEQRSLVRQERHS